MAQANFMMILIVNILLLLMVIFLLLLPSLFVIISIIIILIVIIIDIVLLQLLPSSSLIITIIIVNFPHMPLYCYLCFFYVHLYVHTADIRKVTCNLYQSSMSQWHPYLLFFNFISFIYFLIYITFSFSLFLLPPFFHVNSAADIGRRVSSVRMRTGYVGAGADYALGDLTEFCR